MKHVIWISAAALTAACATYSEPTQDLAFGAPPADVETTVRDFFDEHLREPQGAQIRMNGDAYRAYAHARRSSGGDVIWSGWAADVKVKARTPQGFTGFVDYTVAIRDDKGVALADDFGRFVRVDD